MFRVSVCRYFFFNRRNRFWAGLGLKILTQYHCAQNNYAGHPLNRFHAFSQHEDAEHYAENRNNIAQGSYTDGEVSKYIRVQNRALSAHSCQNGQRGPQIVRSMRVMTANATPVRIRGERQFPQDKGQAPFPPDTDCLHTTNDHNHNTMECLPQKTWRIPRPCRIHQGNKL